MLKKELTELLKTLGDEDNIDETLKKAEPVMALVNSGLSLEAFKKKANDADFKAYLDSEKDKHATKYLDTWKTNNLAKLVDDEYYKKHPEDKKDPVAQELAELKKKYEDSENARKLEAAKTALTKQLTEKKLPIELAEKIADLDETKSNENLTFFENLFKSHDKVLKADFVNHNSYIPGGDDKGGRDDSSVAFAKKMAASSQTDKGLETAKENYFK